VVEVLVAVGVLAVLTGLLLPAVQRVRQATARAQALNQVRQIGLAIQHRLADNDGWVEGVAPAYKRTYFPAWNTWGNVTSYTLFEALIPYIGPPEWRVATETRSDVLMPILISPAMPAWASPPQKHQSYTSCIANAWLFPGTRARVSASCTDGLSNTVAITERHYSCSHESFIDSWWEVRYSQGRHDGASNLRRPTFADGGPIPGMAGRTQDDVYPVTEGSPPRTRPSVPGVTFGPPAVPYGPCRPWTPQSHFPGLLLVGLGDGSVRTVRQGVDPSAFWSAVTPAGGEVLGDW
jgi:type II secretory pathway pseudopilin PulG